jgi:drug/metabolite transporter (DMT)-like permease
VSEMESRHRRVQRVVAGIYLGIPAVLLVVVALISTAGSPAAWVGCLVPIGMLVLGWVLRRRHRYQPRWWAGIGALFGGVSGLMVTLFPLAVGVWWPAFLALPALLVGVVVGALPARYADRVLLVPVVPELADTPYELIFRLRGLQLTAVLLGADSVTIQSRPVLRTQSTDDLGKTYPLSSITGVFEVALSGVERLKFPIPLPHPPVVTAGPAVILQASGDDWVLPTNQAATLIDLLNRRRSTA